MGEDAKRAIIVRLIVRVKTGLSFVEDHYLRVNKMPDGAWIRNIYILLSFYTELALKAAYINFGNFSDSVDLNQQMRTLGHNLNDICVGIGEKNLSMLGITKCIPTEDGYRFETTSGTFDVMDFIDIRYDFVGGKVRTLNGSEHVMFTRQINSLNEIVRRL